MNIVLETVEDKPSSIRDENYNNRIVSKEVEAGDITEPPKPANDKKGNSTPKKADASK
jgi:hypothetical protein